MGLGRMNSTDTAVRQQQAERLGADQGFVDRLQQLIDQAGNASTLAKRAGISHSGLIRYLNGGEPSRKVLMALAQAADVSVQWLAVGTGLMRPDAQGEMGTLRKLPLLSMAAKADVTTPLQDEDFSAQAFCFHWLSKHGAAVENLVALEVLGDSMAPTLRAGAVVLIDRERTHIEDDGIYLIEDSSLPLLRRLQLEVGGQVRVLADNPSHRECVVPIGQLQVRGRVVWGSMFF